MASRFSLLNWVPPVVVVILPLLGAPSRLVHPGPWIALIAGEILLLSQPQIGPRTMVSDRRDRFSALGIYAAQILAPLAATLDFGYRMEFRPAPTSPTVLFAASVVLALMRQKT